MCERQRPVPSGLRTAALLSLLLVALTALAYGRACSNGFIDLDDDDYVTENPHVRAGLSGEGVGWAFTTTDCANWHPLTWLSLQLDEQLYGLAPWGYHLTSLLLHTANAVLLFWLLRAMTGAAWRSFFVAALFAVHPLHVESVAWVAERKDVLSTLFWLLTLWAYLGYVRRGGPSRYLLVLLAFALGLMAKPMVVTLPFVLLLLDCWPLQRMKSEIGNPKSETNPKSEIPMTETGRVWDLGFRVWNSFRISGFGFRILEKLPLFALAAASCLLTLWAQHNAIRYAAAQLEDLTLAARVMNAVVAYVRYMGLAIWPVNLAVLYPHPGSDLPRAHVVGAGLLLASITALVLWTGRRRPYLPVGWFWYLGTLVPVIGLVQVGLQVMADRYTYVPLIGLFIILAWGMADLADSWSLVRLLLGPAAAVVLIACVLGTWVQVGSWHDSAALWEHALAVTEHNWVAQSHLGMIYAGQGRAQSAQRHLAAAVRSNPKHAGAYNSLGVVLAQQGKLDEAVEEFRAGLRIKPDSAELHCNLGACLVRRGKVEEAEQECRAALRIKPGYAEAHFNLGLCLLRQGQGEEALAHFRDAQQIDPRLRPPDKTPPQDLRPSIPLARP